MLDPVQQQNQSKPGKHRSPSYFRRQEKRKLTQSSAAPSHNKKDTEEVSEAVTVTDNVSEAVTDPVIDAEEASTVDHIQQTDNDASLNNGKPKDAGKASDVAGSFPIENSNGTKNRQLIVFCPNVDAGKASDVAVNSESVITQANKDSDKSRSYKENHSVYRCELCDFTCNKATILDRHMSTLHPILEQLDGNVSLASSGNGFQTQPGRPEAQCFQLRTFDGKRPPVGSAEYRILVAENVTSQVRKIKDTKNKQKKKEFMALNLSENVDFFLKWDELVEIYLKKNGANISNSTNLQDSIQGQRDLAKAMDTDEELEELERKLAMIGK